MTDGVRHSDIEVGIEPDFAALHAREQVGSVLAIDALWQQLEFLTLSPGNGGQIGPDLRYPSAPTNAVDSHLEPF